MLQLKVFIRKSRSIYGFSSRSIMIGEISPLQPRANDKNGTLSALDPSSRGAWSVFHKIKTCPDLPL